MSKYQIPKCMQISKHKKSFKLVTDFYKHILEQNHQFPFPPQKQNISMKIRSAYWSFTLQK